MILTGKGGKQYNLEPAPFAQGGEGEIYNVIGQPQIVAKLYKQGKITIEHERKLVTMMSTPPNANVMTQIAWPQDVLYKQGVFVGFIMQKFKLNEDLNVIYEYGSAAKYPDMPWGNKINIAKNICVVVDEVHNSGHIIGDFNPRNINVDPTSGLVVFVDTDSYHIKDGNNVYRCNVGLPEYLAKEIQVKMNGKESLSTCALPTFSQATDKFALAIHIFQLLMNGVHPFACAVLPSQSSVAFPQPTDNILNGQCAFLQNVPGITIPAYAPNIDILPTYMKDLFKRAFVDGHTNPSARPSAEEWYNALDKLQRNLKKCTTVTYHQYEASLNVCPWCAANAKFSRSTSRSGMQTSMGYTPGSGSGGGSRPPMPPQPPRPPQPPKPPTGSGTNSGGSSGGSTPSSAPKKKNKGCGCLIAVLIVLGIIGIAIMSNWDSIMELVDGGGDYVDDTCYYHSYGSWVVEKEATEDNTGLRVKTCTKCGYRDEETIKKLNHTHIPVAIPAVSATCTSLGKTEGSICQKCEAVLTKQKDIAMLPHSYGDWNVEKEATEEETGLQVKVCSECGDRKEETLAKLPHTHISASIPAIAATCNSLGKTEGFYCSKCNEVLTAQKDVPMDHSFANGSCTYCGTTDVPSIGLTMQLNSDKKSYSVTGLGSCTDTKVIIPMTYEGLQVVQISNNSFKGNNKIQSVVLPNCVTTIGSSAFYNCTQLTSVTIGSGVTTIGSSAFQNCESLAKVEIPSSVTSIGEAAFRNCRYLTTVTLNEGLTNIGTSAFRECASIANVSVPSSVNTIGAASFRDCTSLQEVIIGGNNSNKATISNDAFNGCTSLKKVLVGNNVNKIDSSAFYNCKSLTEVTIGTGVTTIGSSAFQNCESLAKVEIPSSVTSIGEAAFRNCRYLTTVTLNEGLTNIGTSAFRECASIANVSVPSSVNTIGAASFRDCISLQEVIIGGNNSNKATISNDAFNGCTSLKKVLIGNNVSKIDSSAFYNCKSLTEVTIGTGVTSIGSSAFYNCENLPKVEIPSSVTSIGEAAFRNCRYLTGVTLTEGLKSIGASAFRSCSSLKSIFIPTSVTSIGNSSFQDCVSIVSVVIGDETSNIDKTTIGNSAFYGCTNLKTLVIGNNVSKIDSSAFYNCTSLVDMTIGIGVTTIGSSAFYNCESLEKVGIPSSVTSIGETAFRNCKNMTDVTLVEGLKSIGASAFRSCSSLKSIFIPTSVTSIGNSSFQDCVSIVSVVIGDETSNIDKTTIGNSAFYGCTNLKTLVIGNNVSKIDSSAFYNCTSLVDVTIGTGVTTIGSSVFYNCKALNQIKYNDTITSWNSVTKGSGWNKNSAISTIKCSDGNASLS